MQHVSRALPFLRQTWQHNGTCPCASLLSRKTGLMAFFFLFFRNGHFCLWFGVEMLFSVQAPLFGVVRVRSGDLGNQLDKTFNLSLRSSVGVSEFHARVSWVMRPVKEL